MMKSPGNFLLVCSIIYAISVVLWIVHEVSEQNVPPPVPARVIEIRVAPPGCYPFLTAFDGPSIQTAYQCRDGTIKII